MRVYRAPGSVAFLSCGAALQPILPKSQCWCVDEEASKFVLQIRRPQYWRIELHNAVPDDAIKATEFKEVLSDVLLFEKTLCPFQRSFHVELPAPPATPVRKRAWTPRVKIRAQTTLMPPQDIESADEYFSAGSDSDKGGARADSDSEGTDETGNTARNLLPVTPDPGESNPRPDYLHAGRSVTAPPQLTLVTSPPSRQSPLSSANTPDIHSSEAQSINGLFDAAQSWKGPLASMPPSPPRSASPGSETCVGEAIHLPKRPYTNSGLLKPTSIAEDVGVWDLTHTTSNDSVSQESRSPPIPLTPTFNDDNDSPFDDGHSRASTPSRTTRQCRRRRATTSSNSARRALSPLPPAANIFSPTHRRPRHLQTAAHLPTAIIQKTCEILLSPPSHLINLMLSIASKIAAGQWRGVVFGFGEGGEKIPVQWDYTDGDPVGPWDEDDYGMSPAVSKASGVLGRNAYRPPGAWEID